jgi:hypothetical protein
MDELSKRLRDVAGRIRGWQTERRLSDSELLRRYRGLGTDRTFGRVIGGIGMPLRGIRLTISTSQIASGTQTVFGYTRRPFRSVPASVGLTPSLVRLGGYKVADGRTPAGMLVGLS